MKFPILCSLVLLLTPWVAPLSVRAAEIAATDSRVRYVGRFDYNDAGGPRCTWSASSVSLVFSGGSLGVKLNDNGKNCWQVVVDGAPAGVLRLKQGEHVYPVATDLPEGRHTVELVKRTEFFVGVTQVGGFVIDDDAKLFSPVARPRRIEVIGDSISCGYGNEAPRKEDRFSTATENAWLAYGAVAAREVDADYVCVAWSGKKLWPNNSILDYYDRVLPDEAAAKWNFSTWTPDVVIINLGTNDFGGKANPDEAGWVAAYVEFIKRIRTHYPKAPVYCGLGTMVSDWPPGGRMVRTTLRGYLEKVLAQANTAGGPPVRLIDFGVQKQENGIGADWHPGLKTHALMGAQLARALKTDLGW
jgi:lysophospholipase L1-like esterase